MRRGIYVWVTIALFIPALTWAAGAEEQLWHYRNLGKAFYENPATQYEAVGAFQKALELAPDSVVDQLNYGLAVMRAGKTEEGIVELKKAQAQDPSIPHTWFNLGIAYKRASQYDLAIEQFEGMVRLVPDEPITHYNLGVLYKLSKQHERALQHFEKAAELDPNLAGPHFQLATAYRQAKRMDDAKKAMTTFRRIKKAQANAPIPEDLEWSFYAEIHEIVDPKRTQSVTAKAALQTGAAPVAGRSRRRRWRRHRARRRWRSQARSLGLVQRRHGPVSKRRHGCDKRSRKPARRHRRGGWRHRQRWPGRLVRHHA